MKRTWLPFMRGMLADGAGVMAITYWGVSDEIEGGCDKALLAASARANIVGMGYNVTMIGGG